MNKSNILLQRPDHVTGFYNNKDVVQIKPEFLAVWVLKGIAVEGEERILLRNIHWGNVLEKQEESVAKAARELQCSHKKFIYITE